MKICRECLIEKPLHDFYTEKRALVGGGYNLHYFSKCKECEKAYQKSMRRKRGILSREEAQRKKYEKGDRWIEGTDPTCKSCGLTKTIDQFYCNLTRKGLRPIQSMCKVCKSEWAIAHRITLKEKYASSVTEKGRVTSKINVRTDFQHTVITIDGEKIKIGRKVDREIEIKLRKHGYHFLFKGYGDK